MQYTIKEFFSTIVDPRRGQGQRHTLENIMTIIMMAIISGHQGIRGFCRFAENNETELTEVLKLKVWCTLLSHFSSYSDYSDRIE